jgi:hypothetical protein
VIQVRGIAVVLLAIFASGSVHAGVLPEERTDVAYQLYTGGGVDINVPHVLVRKQAGSSLSFVGSYYLDMVSSASIDVITTASPYSEERKQWSLGMDYLRGNTIMSLNFTSTEESDYDGSNVAFAVSQDMFGDLTTISLSYSYSDDIVGNSGDPNFEEELKRQQYGVGLTQILTRNLISTLNFTVITDEGYLNNPYRSVRYEDPGTALGYSYEPELYPNTRTSTAIGIRAKYYLPYRAAIEAEYRFFEDTWDIKSDTASLTYIHPIGPWTFTAKYRHHDQTGASFFSDIFTRPEQTNFRGRDKELSPLTSTTIRLGAAYEFISGAEGWKFIDKASVNASIDFLHVDYHEFKDLSTGAAFPDEPLYELDAAVFQLFFSFWY